MDEIKLKTTKPIDISHYSDRTYKPYKLMFKNVKLVDDDPQKQIKKVIYGEYAILGDPIVTQVERLDENGEVVRDAQGNIVYDTKTIDNVKFLRNIPPEEVTYDEWFALKNMVYSQLPADMPESEKYKMFLKEGIKQTIVNKGFYHGQLTLNDFE